MIVMEEEDCSVNVTGGGGGGDDTTTAAALTTAASTSWCDDYSSLLHGVGPLQIVVPDDTAGTDCDTETDEPDVMVAAPPAAACRLDDDEPPPMDAVATCPPSTSAASHQLHPPTLPDLPPVWTADLQYCMR